MPFGYDFGGGFTGGGSPSLSNLSDYGASGFAGGGSPSLANVDQSGMGGGFLSGFLKKLKKKGGASDAPAEDDISGEIPGAMDEIGAAVTGPTRKYQARLIGLAPEAVGIGSSIQPVAQSRGGAQMAAAAAHERLGATRMLETEQMGDLERRYRKVSAEGSIAKNAAVIIRRLVTEYFSGGMGG